MTSTLPDVDARGETDPNPIGSVIVLCGAALAVVALWLPYWDAESLRRAWPTEPGLHDPQNLVERGHASIFLVVAVSCALSVLIAYLRQRKTWGPAITGIVAIFLAATVGLMAVNSSVFAVTQAESPDPGLGIYAEGVAGALMVIGGLQIRRPRQETIAMSLILAIAAVLIVRLLFMERHLTASIPANQ